MLTFCIAELSVPTAAVCGEEFFSDPVTLVVDALPAGAFSYTSSDFEVTFSNQSTGATSYTWLFGDGGQSGEENPVHTYSGNGDYEVALIARNDCGADTLREQVSLDIGVAPQAAFSFAPTSGCG